MSALPDTQPYTSVQVAQAYSIIRKGGLILISLDVGYGFVGHSEESIRRMCDLKGRRETNPGAGAWTCLPTAHSRVKLRVVQGNRSQEIRKCN